MIRVITIFAFFMCSICSSMAQDKGDRPDEATALNQTSPGTLKAKISLLSFMENAQICGMTKSSVAKIKIVEVTNLGSGLVNVPNSGDTLLIEIRSSTEQVTVSEEEEYVLKENPCLSSGKSYFLLFK